MAKKSIKQFDEKSDEQVYVSVRETLESARGKVERAVNSAMVEAYWEIGRQIVEATGERAEYGKHLVQYLAERLTAEYGKGFDYTNLTNMRKFYQAFPILDTVCQELSWSHYRRLMRIPNQEQREFYMKAAVEEHWTVRQLDHQIATFYRERLLSSQGEKRELIRSEIQRSEPVTAADDFIKDPYVLDFLDLGGRTDFDEHQLEQALMTRLQEFMLELGRGFAFVGRQYRLDGEQASYYVDLVFYNIKLKCYVLIELKTRPLNAKDVGQMDFYVRLFNEKTVAKYSALADGKGLFASSYVTCLPTEEELTDALEPTRRAIAEARAERDE